MSVQIILIAHENVGESLLEVVRNTIGSLPANIKNLSIKAKNSAQTIRTRLQKLLHLETDQEAYSEILILTDLYGSTPCNLAMELKVKANIRIVSGLNLPMLIRVVNYANIADLDELTDIALQGGQKGVMNA